jgi:capsular polysaccharide biosynthesis protein
MPGFVIRVIKKYLWEPIINSARPDLCEHVVGTALLYKWPVKKIHEPFIFELPVPEGFGIDDAAKAAFAMNKATVSPVQHLVCIPGGVASGGGFIQLPNKEFLTESAFRIECLVGPSGADFYRARYRRHKVYLQGDCYYLDMLFTANYAHWFFDELPRLVSALPHLPPETKFIVNEPLHHFKLQSLEALGISKDRLIPVKGYVQARCERLWFATPFGSAEWGTTSPMIFRKIGKVIAGYYADAGKPAPERIFISRSATKYKRLANEDQLLPLIERYGFSVVQTETMSFPQQVQTFSKAKVILGAHGAGMTNLLFSPMPALLLELQDAKFAPRHWYWKVASCAGCRYSTITGPTTGKLREGFEDFTDTHFTISPASLEKFLEEELQSEKHR